MFDIPNRLLSHESRSGCLLVNHHHHHHHQIWSIAGPGIYGCTNLSGIMIAPNKPHPHLTCRFPHSKKLEGISHQLDDNNIVGVRRY